MTESEQTSRQRDLLDQLRNVRARAIEHTVAARQLAVERRDLINALVAVGLSQADIARELSVTRQAIQKMVRLVPGSEELRT
jgi:DNA-binding NarL/FixJ family response regulator